MVLASLGQTLSEATLRALCDCTLFGTEAFKAVEAIRQLGFPGTAKQTLSTDELTAQIHQGLYPIVFVNTRPIDGITNSHALVVLSMDHASVAVYDPLYGERHLPHTTFVSAWAMMHNLAILIQP
jgi:ABC-type bacteriocin/lantibiotic exporter with double-glycine peptidase domain